MVDLEGEVKDALGLVPECKVKQYLTELMKRTWDPFHGACIHHCNGRDVDCIYWVAQYGTSARKD